MFLRSSLLLLVFLSTDINCVYFTEPGELVNEDGYVVLGLTLIKLDSTPYGQKKWRTLSQDLIRMVTSLLYHSPDTNIHFIIITDRSSLTGYIAAVSQSPFLRCISFQM